MFGQTLVPLNVKISTHLRQRLDHHVKNSARSWPRLTIQSIVEAGLTKVLDEADVQTARDLKKAAKKSPKKRGAK